MRSYPRGSKIVLWLAVMFVAVGVSAYALVAMEAQTSDTDAAQARLQRRNGFSDPGSVRAASSGGDLRERRDRIRAEDVDSAFDDSTFDEAHVDFRHAMERIERSAYDPSHARAARRMLSRMTALMNRADARHIQVVKESWERVRAYESDAEVGSDTEE